jgi:hypothetical protein
MAQEIAPIYYIGTYEVTAYRLYQALWPTIDFLILHVEPFLAVNVPPLVFSE